VKTIIYGLTLTTVFAIAQVNVQKGESGVEASAIGALRAVWSAQQLFADTNRGYASSLSTLAGGCAGASPGFVSPHLGIDPAIVSGYAVRLHATLPATDRHLDCHGTPTAAAYYATAEPVQRAGRRAFAVDQNAAIWYDLTGVAPTPPFRETATVRELR
jgi:hypothetical protein